MMRHRKKIIQRILLISVLTLFATTKTFATTQTGGDTHNAAAGSKETHSLPGRVTGERIEKDLSILVNRISEQIKNEIDPITHVVMTEEKEYDEFPFEETDENVYNYCPSVIKEGNAYYIFYTKLHDSDYGWQDYIYMRKCVPEEADGSGIWKYSEEKLVLQPTEDEFDSHHVCDPSVIAGEFEYDGESYKYMMAYLATTHSNAPMCRNNDVGIAVSNDLVNWTKCGRKVSHQTVGNPWGVGQPSLIKDNGGDTIVIYTGDNMQARHIFSDTEEGDIISVSTKGTKNMHNADFATERDDSGNIIGLYVIYDSNWSDPQVSSISDSAIIYRSDWDGTLSGLKDLSWDKIDEIDEDDTGFRWNHNSCLTKDLDGNFKEDTAFISKCTKYGQGHEYTYRIFMSEFGK